MVFLGPRTHFPAAASMVGNETHGMGHYVEESPKGRGDTLDAEPMVVAVFAVPFPVIVVVIGGTPSAAAFTSLLLAHCLPSYLAEWIVRSFPRRGHRVGSLIVVVLSHSPSLHSHQSPFDFVSHFSAQSISCIRIDSTHQFTSSLFDLPHIVAGFKHEAIRVGLHPSGEVLVAGILILFSLDLSEQIQSLKLLQGRWPSRRWSRHWGARTGVGVAVGICKTNDRCHQAT